MSSTNPGHIVTKDTTDQKRFLVAILGGIILILLVLMCLLLYYCRRKVLKPRQLLKKLRLPLTFRAAKKDQSTSVSHLNLVYSRRESEFPSELSVIGNRHPESSGHKEVVMVDVHVNKGCSGVEEVIHTPVLQHTYSSSQEFSPREESLSHNENDQSCMSLESMTSFFINSGKSLEKIEEYGSPDKGDHKCSFNAMLRWPLFEKQEQTRFQVELSNAHPQQQMQLQRMQPQHLAVLAVSQQQLQEAGRGDWKPQNVAMSESVSIPASLNDELLTKKALKELGGGQPLPHPKSWFVSLDGHSNTVRHSYMDLQTTERNGIKDISLDSGYGMNDPKSAQKGRGDNLQQAHQQTQMQLPSLQEETIKRNVETPSKFLPDPEHKMTGCSEADGDGSDSDDGHHQREDKMSPWQEREERPVMTFNLK